MNMNEVVRGEASESEDETMDLKEMLAAEVIGEASESDEDVYEKNLEHSIDCKGDVGSIYHNNLLQRKLNMKKHFENIYFSPAVENNLSICRSLNIFVKSIVSAASKQLLLADQLLIKSQTSMQSVLVTLGQAEVNTKQLHEKTDAVFTANFIPNINVPLNRKL